MSDLYERDVYLWSHQQAAALRDAAKSGLNLPIDWENVAEEIESVGKSEKRELQSRLIVLLSHLLKWQFQPIYRGKSWYYTIAEQRRSVERHLLDNPSLRAKLGDEIIPAVYPEALLRAYQQTGLSEDTFPTTCPYTADQILDQGYRPGED